MFLAACLGFFSVRGFPLYFCRRKTLPNINNLGRPSGELPGNYLSLCQDACGHDKGQKSTISGRRLHWIFEFSPVDFLRLSPGLLCKLVRKSPQNVEKIARLPGGEKSVESCHASGCHGFFFLTLPQEESGKRSLAKKCRSIRKNDQKVTQRVPKTQKVSELLLPTSPYFSVLIMAFSSPPILSPKNLLRLFLEITSQGSK